MLKFLQRILGGRAAGGSESPAAGPKQADQGLRHSEEHFERLVANVRDYAIFLLDRQGNVLTWNAGAEQIKGYRADEIIGRHFSTFYPAEAVASGWPAHELEEAAKTGRFEDEARRVRKDGSPFWANVIITALYDESGAVRGFLKITRDLTDQKRAEENARRLLQEETARQAAETSAREAERARREERRHREQLHVTLTSIGDGVIVTDKAGAVSFMNPVAVELTGWTPHEAAGQALEHVFRIINEQTRQPVADPVRKVLREGTVIGLANHTVLIARDGREIPIDDSGAPIRGEDETIAGVVLVFRDVSEARKAVEARLHLAAIVESSDDAIISKDLNGIIISWNQGAERMYGYTAEEIVGKPLSILAPPDHPDELPALLERIKRGERVEHYETVRRCKDGSQVDVSLTISPVKNAEGRIIGASKIARDITARKKYEAALQEADRQKNEWIAMLAHELRNPLAPIRNALHLMKMPGADVQAIENARKVTERQVEQMVRLVDDLLDVSRIIQGRIELRKDRVDLATVIARGAETAQPTIDARGQQLIVSTPPEPLQLEGDPMRLAQVVSNLLHNAAKFSERSGRIWLAAERDGTEAVLRVRDEGVGISADLLPRIFDLFTQGDRSLERSQSGLGIGLTVVRRLVEMHGGSVSVHSAGPGKGSEFIVRLPGVRDDIIHAPGEVHLHSGRPPARRRILVVDDNVDAAESAAMVLRFGGHDVHLAFNGPEALSAAEQFDPEVVLLDIGLPGMNGYEVARRLRQQPKFQKTLLVAVTGYGQEEDRHKSQQAGFDRHLVKPVNPDVLEEILRSWTAS